MDDMYRTTSIAGNGDECFDGARFPRFTLRGELQHRAGRRRSIGVGGKLRVH